MYFASSLYFGGDGEVDGGGDGAVDGGGCDGEADGQTPRWVLGYAPAFEL